MPIPAPTVAAFVTGATGFIGRRLIPALLETGYSVAALTLPGEAHHLPGEVRIFRGDVTDVGALSAALSEATPTHIFHLAAVGITDLALPMAEACRVNVGGVINVLEVTRGLPSVQRVVLAGTSYEYGARRADDGLDPFNAYSASKVAAWAFARAAHNAWQLPVVTVRPFQVYGPGQRRNAVVPAAIAAALRHEDFRMTLGEQQRDFIFVADVVRGLLAAAEAPDIEGRVLDLGTGELHPVRDVVERIWDLTASKGRILAGALPYRPGEVPAIPANVHRTRLLTGWQATIPLEQGLQRTIDAMQAELDAESTVATEGPQLEADYVE